MTPDRPMRGTARLAPTLFGDLAADHHVIRDLVDRLEQQTENVSDLAEELSNLLARHRSTGVESVIACAGDVDHQQEVRLLLAAVRGMDQLTDRLRLPARDPMLIGNILVALRGLEHEHERLETELLTAEIDRAAIVTETVATETVATETIATETVATETVATETVATETIASPDTTGSG